MTALDPHHGDGKAYTGECLCCGVRVTGPVAKSRPGPYLANDQPFGGNTVRAVLLSTTTGAHDVPLAAITGVSE